MRTNCRMDKSTRMLYRQARAKRKRRQQTKRNKLIKQGIPLPTICNNGISGKKMYRTVEQRNPWDIVDCIGNPQVYKCADHISKLKMEDFFEEFDTITTIPLGFKDVCYILWPEFHPFIELIDKHGEVSEFYVHTIGLEYVKCIWVFIRLHYGQGWSDNKRFSFSKYVHITLTIMGRSPHSEWLKEKINLHYQVINK